jgi:hypothetical protein
MIAAALRTQIDHFCRDALERSETEALARCALATQRMTQGLQLDGAEKALPSMTALSELVHRALRSHRAAFLAYRALAEQLAMHALPSMAPAAAREDAFDAIDDLVDDPTELPVLRSEVAAFCEHFQRLCQEATRAPRRLVDVSASAA